MTPWFKNFFAEPFAVFIGGVWLLAWIGLAVLLVLGLIMLINGAVHVAHDCTSAWSNC